MARWAYVAALLCVVAVASVRGSVADEEEDGDDEIAAQSGGGPQFQEQQSYEEQRAVCRQRWRWGAAAVRCDPTHTGACACPSERAHACAAISSDERRVSPRRPR